MYVYIGIHPFIERLRVSINASYSTVPNFWELGGGGEKQVQRRYQEPCHEHRECYTWAFGVWLHILPSVACKGIIVAVVSLSILE